MFIQESLTFDDVLLVPQYSEISSRALTSTQVELREFSFSLPVVPANMKTVTEKEMCLFMYENKCMSLLHRFMPIQNQLVILSELKQLHNDIFDFVGVSIGVKEEDQTNLTYLTNLGVKIICIDIAHGDSKSCVDMIKHIKETYPKVFIIAGNVATESGAMRLYNAGANVVKVGIGNGSTCLTRTETGVGVAQFSAILNAVKAKKEYEKNVKGLKQVYIIADGNIRTVSDICKAIAAGSDMIMAGNIFASTDKAPGEISYVNNQAVKEYNGSSTENKKDRIEGVKAYVKYSGKTKDLLSKIKDGLQSCCSYNGVDNLTDLKEVAIFQRITNAGLKESGAHDVIVK